MMTTLLAKMLFALHEWKLSLPGDPDPQRGSHAPKI